MAAFLDAQRIFLTVTLSWALTISLLCSTISLLCSTPKVREDTKKYALPEYAIEGDQLTA